MATALPHVRSIEASQGVDLSPLVDAAARSDELLNQLRELAYEVGIPDEASTVIMGSIGRREATSGSDVDFSIVVPHRPEEIDQWAAYQQAVNRFREGIAGIGLKGPGPTGIFGAPMHIEGLCKTIGLQGDTNRSLTQRLLLLLEAVPVANEARWDGYAADLRETYLAVNRPKDHAPPRFLLNDVIRYWRTICVDYEAKVRKSNQEGWAIRNAKLRTSRKILFAAGILPLLRCSEMPSSEYDAFIAEQLSLPTCERVASAFEYFDQGPAGARCLGAYARFLLLVDDAAVREELEALAPENRSSSTAWSTAKDIGHELQEGLEELLFSDRVVGLTRRYMMF